MGDLQEAHFLVIYRFFSYLERYAVSEDGVRGELSVHGAGSDGEDPRCDVSYCSPARTGVAGGANDGDSVLNGVEGTDSDPVGDVVDGPVTGTAEGN